MDERIPVVTGLLMTVSLFNIFAAVLYTRREPSYVYPASAISLAAIWLIATRDAFFTVGTGTVLVIAWSLAALYRRSKGLPIMSYDMQSTHRSVIPAIIAFAISLAVAFVAVAIATILGAF